MDELEQLRAENLTLKAEVAYLRAEIATLKEISCELSWHAENARENQEILDRQKW